MKTLFKTSFECIRQHWHLYDESAHDMINDLIWRNCLTNELMVEAKTVFDSFKTLTGRNTSDTWQRKAHALKELETFVRLNLAIDPGNFHFLDKHTNQLTRHMIRWKLENQTSFQKIQWRRLLKRNGKNYPRNLGVISKNPQTFRELIVRLVQRNLYTVCLGK